MKTGRQGIELIKHFEGCYLKAYKCPAGVWTIGIGTTVYESGQNVKEGDQITIERAIELLEFDLTRFEFYVNKNVTVPLTQCQFDALVSLVYNIGIGNFLKSTLLKVIRFDPVSNKIPECFTRYRFAGKKELPGLLRRRKAEAHLYMTGELNFFEDEKI